MPERIPHPNGVLDQRLVSLSGRIDVSLPCVSPDGSSSSRACGISLKQQPQEVVAVVAAEGGIEAKAEVVASVDA
jgi:hypothetical protein